MLIRGNTQYTAGASTARTAGQRFCELTFVLAVLLLCTTGSVILAADLGTVGPELVEIAGSNADMDLTDQSVQASSGHAAQDMAQATDQQAARADQPAVLPLVSPVSVGAGESVVLGVLDAERVAVADPGIADIAVISRYEVLVTGRTPGQTTLHIWDQTGLQKLDVRVFENTVALMQDFHKRLGLPDVEAWMHQGTIVLEGVVASAADRERAIQLAGAYGKVVDLLRVISAENAADAATGNMAGHTASDQTPDAQPVLSVDEVSERLTELSLLIAEPNLHLQYVQGRLVLDGSVSSTQAKQRALQLASLYFPNILDVTTVREETPQGDPDMTVTISALLDRPEVHVYMAGDRVVLEGKLRDQLELDRALKLAGGYGREVIHFITLTHPLQVALKVHVLEVNKAGALELGVAWGSQNPAVTVIDANNYYFGEMTVGGAFTRLVAIGARVRAVTEGGKGRLLAAPTLVTLPEVPASFLAGGEVPVITPQGDGTLTTAFHTYGVKLQVTPQITAEGDVIVSLEPEVSTLDWANGVKTSGFTIPAFRTRRTNTRVFVKDGDTVVISGLLNQEDSKGISKVPLLGSLPVIGQLFRSAEFSKGETELLFLVTPQVLAAGAGPVPEAVVAPGTLTAQSQADQSADVLEMAP
jgi:pilus assembly protein CpaC